MKKLLLLLLFSCNAHAQYFTGEMLYNALTGNKQYQQIGEAYVLGVYDTGKDAVHCAPKDPDPKVLINAVKVVLKENTRTQDWPADVIITKLLVKTWPCPTKGTI